jgi:membrane-associated phospholipid phosphatase
MKKFYRVGVLVLFACAGIGGVSNSAWAQSGEAGLPDSPSAASADDNGAAPESPNEREATWKTLPGNFLHDQKDIWLFPAQLARGRHWVPTLAVAGITAGLIYADPHAMPYFRAHATNWDDFNDTFDAYITTGEVISLPAGLLTSGYIRHDHRTVSSALLCAEAYGDSAIVNLAIKAVTRRQRPVDVPLNGNYRDTFFNGGKSPFHGSSFPSGHTTGVFSVATVVANRYARHRWVPYVSYGFATLISLSRITTAAHWPSDVFLGAAIGYSTSKYVVLRPQ